MVRSRSRLKNERNTVIKITTFNSGIKISVKNYVIKKNKKLYGITQSDTT